VIRYVVDASSVGPLVVPDEAENLIPAVANGLTDEECIVPAHWHFEVGNLGLMAVRRKRADLQIVLANLHDLAQFKVEIDLPSSELAWTTSIQLAQRYGLTLYDAAYLELARRRALVLLSADGRLLDAAAREGVATNLAP
jgi:predicted nucleic acid-binding protein